MTEDQVLEAVTNELCTKHGCHTVILYGSRARGDATDASDYDIMGVRDAGETLRDARLWNGVYLDIFVYAKNELDDPHSGMLDMRHGKVLREKNDTAKKFFAKLESMDAKGPNKLRTDEIAALRSWHLKALDRIRLGGIQGNLRRSELMPAMLEHFFTTRGEWYRGPKASFLWLEKNQPDLYAKFEHAFEPTASVETIEKLVTHVNQEIDRYSNPAKAAKTGEKTLRPDFIKHWNEIQDDKPGQYRGSDELLSLGSALGKKLGLTKIGIHHEVLPPGRRTSWPHAESAEEEFGFVLEGTPDVWINGTLYPLKPGDAVAFPAGTGIAHTFINNTHDLVRLLVVGEANKKENKIFYPCHPQRNAEMGDSLWTNYPAQNTGPHDGFSDELRPKTQGEKKSHPVD